MTSHWQSCLRASSLPWLSALLVLAQRSEMGLEQLKTKLQIARVADAHGSSEAIVLRAATSTLLCFASSMWPWGSAANSLTPP